MNTHKVKHHRNTDTKTANRDHIRTTALERSVINYWGPKTSFTPATSPSVTDVEKTFILSLYFKAKSNFVKIAICTYQMLRYQVSLLQFTLNLETWHGPFVTQGLQILYECPGLTLNYSTARSNRQNYYVCLFQAPLVLLYIYHGCLFR